MAQREGTACRFDGRVTPTDAAVARVPVTADRRPMGSDMRRRGPQSRGRIKRAAKGPAVVSLKSPPSARCRFTRCARRSLCSRSSDVRAIVMVALGAPLQTIAAFVAARAFGARS